MLNGSVCQFADWERAATAAATSPQQWQLELAGYLSRVAGGGEYPNLAAALSSGGQPADPEVSFERYLDRLLTVLFPE
ncbi:hypothetical protein LN042_01185 [Kitasatospora sp. RB6PN24]|uniref:hypothetical protein n=1 Tax=Kitasatospora humi TaxID=2893891 RepID=UPI001E4AA8C4|nr:hypothetical protein [Kitasatospora humi]MCC9305735.1 hypothetical protein [Kitasatospora humi]